MMFRIYQKFLNMLEEIGDPQSLTLWGRNFTFKF